MMVMTTIELSDDSTGCSHQPDATINTTAATKTKRQKFSGMRPIAHIQPLNDVHKWHPVALAPNGQVK